MKPLQLLAVTTSYPLRQDAAAGVFIRRVYEHLPAHWEVAVVCPDDTRGQDGTGSPRVAVHAVRYAPRRWQVLSQGAGGIVPALQANRRLWLLLPCLLGGVFLHCVRLARYADVIHANWSISGALAGVAGMLSGRPVVTTLRGDDVVASLGSRLHRWILGAALRRSARIVCVSGAMAEQLQARYPRHAGKISVCRNGVEDAFLQVVHSVAQPGRLRIVAVASLIRRKGLDVLIDAMSLARGRAGMTLRVAGDGPERSALAALVERSGLSGQVEFIGPLPPNDVPAFLADADVYAMSSRSEGRPNVVVEALAAGLPVVSTDLPGNAGLVVADTNGWVVPIGDARAMAAALDDAMDNPERRIQMGRDARARITAGGETWPATARRYDEIFRSAMGDAQGGRG